MPRWRARHTWRRWSAGIASCVGLVAACDAPPSDNGRSPTAPSTRPNLLLVTMDTTRADALGAYGQTRPTTPELDRLAASGVLFQQVTTTNPETLPAHASILTGRWPTAHGVRGNTGYVLADRHVTLAELLQGRGYATGVEIAASVLRRETRITQGFEHYRGADSPGVRQKVVPMGGGKVLERPIRLGADISERGIAFLRENRDRSFFLWLHYFDAHDPYTAPQRFTERIPDSPYHAGVAYQDAQIGRVVAELERLGLADETLVVLTADHGEGLEEHDEPTHRFFVYETTMRVPLILWGLDLPRGRSIAAPVRTVDILPTVIELLGMPPVEGIDGISLVPLIEGRTPHPDLPVYGEATRFQALFGLTPLRLLRRGDWKYIHKVNPELYDLARDPGELENLAARRPEIAEDLRSRLQELLAAAPAVGRDARVAVDAATAAQLQALGYVGADVAPVALEDELASLALVGDDPVTFTDDIRRIARIGPNLQSGHFAEALDAAQPLAARNPDNPFVLAMLAAALVGLERNDEALEVLERLLELDPRHAKGRIGLASVYRRTGRQEEAVEVLRTLAAEDPCNAEVQLDLNQLLYGMGRHAEQLEALRTGAEACPRLHDNLNNYAWVLATAPDAELRDGPRAVEVARAALEARGGPDPSYLDTLAAALAEAGRFEEAVRTQSRSVAILEAAGAPRPLVAGARARLEAYRAGRPTRDPAGA